MAENLRDVWHQVESLLDQNISLVPVRDKDEIYNGKLYEAKTPYREWKKYQYEIIDRAVLFHQMDETYKTTAVAMVCGAVSGNLEVIDFDTKYYPGIDATVVSAIKELYPDIYKKLRRHRTRSGGMHLVYRITQHEVPPSEHLAERAATEQEIEANPRGKKTRCYIETRGTGSMATAPPSLGYALISPADQKIQEILWEERCSIIELCRTYNEYIKEVEQYKPPKSEQNYYDENPFEHYNRTVDPKELLEQFDWTFVKKHGNYIWFTRPGGKRGEVHAGFNTTKCTYRVWGTKADLDSDRSYTPSTILAHYRFNGDKSACYAWLVQQGYGRIKPAMERHIARTRAIQGMAMPTNASPEAVAQYNEQVQQQQQAHPYGIYWEPSTEEEGKMQISRLGFKEVATQMGFRVYTEALVQIVEQFIYRRDLRYFFDTMRDYIHEDDPDLYEQIYNATQGFLERHGKFESTQLPILCTDCIITDNRETCYKFYQNGYVHITANGYELFNYETLQDKLIWHEKVQQRFFNFNDADSYRRGLYTDFLDRACDLSTNRLHVMKCIGYLIHDYNDESLGYIIVLTEKCENPDDGGGTGKNLFGNLLKLTTTYKAVPGSQIQLNEKFLQSWNGERIFCISDAEEDFRFGFLKDLTTGQILIKKLWKNDEVFDINLLPKMVVNTNFSYEIKDGGLKRRIIHIEFTDFFTVNGGVRKHYGKMFPHDWQQEDYTDYDNFICESIQVWLKDMVLQKQELSVTGWEKQFALTYHNTIVTFIKKNWDTWREKQFISNADFNKQLDEHLVELNINPNSKFKPTAFRMNKALKDWCARLDYTLHLEAVERVSPYETMKGRRFLPNDPPF